jgi:hypothetical protein
MEGFIRGAVILLGSIVLALLTIRAPLMMKLGVLAFCTTLSNNAFTSKRPTMVTATILLFAGATVVGQTGCARHGGRSPRCSGKPLEWEADSRPYIK